MIGLCSPIPRPANPSRPQPNPSCEGWRRRSAALEHQTTAALASPEDDSDAAPGFPLPRALNNGSVRLGVPRPSWIVRTESNVTKEKMKKPDPPCVVCNGSGRIDCHHCRGRGRTNCVNLDMLPKGEWPKCRCMTCGGSGLGYCNRCLGTGEYRDIMGFHFMKIGTDRS